MHSVDKLLLHLNSSNAAGSDEPQPRLLKELKTGIVLILTIILQKSLNIQGIPYNWKTVHIVSIYKKGTKYNSENYDFSDMHLLQTTIFWDN
jgi:hypothetical protein